MKRISVLAALLLMLLPLASGCSGKTLPDFGLTAKEIMEGALEEAANLGYNLSVTSYESNSEVSNGVKTTTYSYIVNDYLYLYIESSSVYGDSILVGLDDSVYYGSDYMTAIDEWGALFSGVLMTVDTSADYDEFNNLFATADTIVYHGIIYSFYDDGDVSYVMVTME